MYACKMANKKCKICRLCLHAVSDSSLQSLEEIANIVQSILPRLNLEISSNPIICGTCNELVQKSYTYKLSCLETEKSYMDKTNHFTLSAGEVTDDNCCKVCLQPVEKDHFRKFGKLEAGMMEICIPQLDQSLLQIDIICERCFDRLQVYYSFVQVCLNVEEKIDNYFKAYFKTYGEVDLQSILEFSLKTDTYFDIPEIKQEKFEENNLQSTDTSNEMNESGLTKEEIFIKDESDVYDTHLETEIQTSEALEIESHQMFKCDNCSYQSKFKSNLTRHIALVHTDPRELEILKCNQCQYQARAKVTLKRHMLVHEDSLVLPRRKGKVTFECAKCTYITTNQQLLVRHLMVHQDSSKLQMFKCLKCSYETKFKSNLTKHMVKHKNSTELEMFKCSQCKYQAKRKRELKVHNMLVHKAASEVAMYECNECSYQTKQKSCLTKHILIHMSKDQLAIKGLMHWCPHCSYMARQKSALNQHVRLHKKPEESDSDSDLYKCSQCSFKSIYKSSFVKHALVHKSLNKASMYECDICSFPARTKLDLKAHMKTHKKEFKCDECFFETKFKSILNAHVRIHESQR